MEQRNHRYGYEPDDERYNKIFNNFQLLDIQIMGTQVLLDIMAAMMIGGTLLLTLNQVNFNTISSFFYFNNDFVLQNQLLDVIQIVENDFKRIAYSSDPAAIPDPGECILYADSVLLRYLGDVDNDGTVDQIEYTLGPVSELASTKNPKDRILYRKVNSDNKLMICSNVTSFELEYFNYAKEQLPVPMTVADAGEISTIQISIEVQSPDAFEQDYNQAYWRQLRLAIKNLNNR